MLNQTVLVGRLVRDPELYETETGKKVTKITLAVPRNFKDINGQYQTDFIDCTLWQGVAESTAEYVQKGDLLGIKARLQSRSIVTEDETKKTIMEVVADKVTFLSSRKKEADE